MGFILSIIGYLLYLIYSLIKVASLSKFSIHKSRPYRNLSDAEKAYLQGFAYKNTVKTRTFVRIILFGLVGLVSFIQLLNFLVTKQFDLNTLLIIWPVALICVAFITYAGYLLVNEVKDKIASDLKTSVSMIQDQFNVEFKLRDNYDFKVGNYGFKYSAINEAYQEIAKSLKQGDHVTVEFSPNTHFIWRIEIMLKK
jgi:hypothetical protein